MVNTAFAMGNLPQTAGQPGGGLAGFIPIILMFVIFYFLLIRPQQKKAKEHRDMISNLKKGNRVITSGGIFGTIVSLDETSVGLEIADKIKIKIARGNIGGVINDSTSSKA